MLCQLGAKTPELVRASGTGEQKKSAVEIIALCVLLVTGDVVVLVVLRVGPRDSIKGGVVRVLRTRRVDLGEFVVFGGGSC